MKRHNNTPQQSGAPAVREITSLPPLNVPYYAITAMDQAAARQLFERRYGHAPEHVYQVKGVLFLGPIQIHRQLAAQPRVLIYMGFNHAILRALETEGGYTDLETLTDFIKQIGFQQAPRSLAARIKLALAYLERDGVVQMTQRRKGFYLWRITPNVIHRRDGKWEVPKGAQS